MYGTMSMHAVVLKMLLIIILNSMMTLSSQIFFLLTSVEKFTSQPYFQKDFIQITTFEIEVIFQTLKISSNT